ncbi:MAG: HAD family phosphatase [Pirellulales bacterium]|nr:HAD family phosphatase [Pirellulales bacterium]
MNTRRHKAVVFDLDGLMFNTEELYRHVGSELLARRGKPCTQELLNAMMGRSVLVSLSIMVEWHSLDDTPEALSVESQEIFAEILDDRLEPMHGLFELLDALESGGIPKAIATGSRRVLVENVLSRFDLAPRFEFVLTSDEVSNGKPHPEIYLKSAARLGYEPGEILVLEDSENGCRSAVAAGTFVVAVPGDHSHHHDFTGASLSIDNLADARLFEVLGLKPLS